MEEPHQSDDCVLERLMEFKTNDVLSEFLNNDFDVQLYATNLVQSANISHRLAQLDDGICMLDKELHSQIACRHGDLLAQATGIESLEGVLTMMQTRIHSIQSAVDRIHSKVGEPYKKIQARTTQLGRLQNTCDLLRRIIRIQRISKRLRGQLYGGIKEITKAALSLKELEHLSEGIDLQGIDVFDENQVFFHRAKEEVHTQANHLLEQGLRSLNQTHTATALQVFYNMSCLQVVVNKVRDDAIENVRKSVTAALSNPNLTQQQNTSSSFSKNPGKMVPMQGSSALLRANLWNNIELLVDGIATTFNQLVHLRKILLKKRDPVSHVLFADEVGKDGEQNFLQTFWIKTTDALQGGFIDNSILKNTLESEYPKLLRYFDDLWQKVEPHRDLLQKGKVNGQLTSYTATADVQQTFNARGTLMASLGAFETAFLQKSLSRLFDPINLLFPPGGRTAPSAGDLDTVIKTISSEMSVASADASLCVSVARNVGKTLQLFAAKSEQMLATQGDASQVIGPPTTMQTRNVAIVNSLYRLQAAINKMMVEMMDGGGGELPEQACEIIARSCEHLSALMMNAVHPLVESVADSIEAILLTMHDEDFDEQGDTSEPVLSSLYMRELRDFVSRVVKDHFAQFVCKDFVMQSLLPLGHRCISLFVRHASLLRPISERGKAKLSADFTQLEQVLAPLCHRLADFTHDYRLMRSFKSLLFQSDHAIAQSGAVGDVIPRSVALHVLISRSPALLRSPHQVMDWSVGQYSRWLDSHPGEQERLNMVRGAVESYINLVRSQHGQEFASAYPVILQLLQQGVDALSSPAVSAT